jgi:hypothetical protein
LGDESELLFACPALKLVFAFKSGGFVGMFFGMDHFDGGSTAGILAGFAFVVAVESFRKVCCYAYIQSLIVAF